MSILDKKLFLAEFEKRLGDIATANEVRRIIEHAADVLTGYELTAEKPGGSSESDSLIDLFLSAIDEQASVWLAWLDEDHQSK